MKDLGNNFFYKYVISVGEKSGHREQSKSKIRKCAPHLKRGDITYLAPEEFKIQ